MARDSTKTASFDAFVRGTLARLQNLPTMLRLNGDRTAAHLSMEELLESPVVKEPSFCMWNCTAS